MIPFLVIGFFWTYISFRKKEQETLLKEVEKLQTGVLSELRRLMADILRQAQGQIVQHYSKQIKEMQNQVSASLESFEEQRLKESTVKKKKAQEQKQSVEKRSRQLKDFKRELERLARESDGLDTLQLKWLQDWIGRFNQGKLPPLQ
ncbi:MAG: hypothetical protein ACPGN3_03665 [Opitutales bacterium]